MPVADWFNVKYDKGVAANLSFALYVIYQFIES